MVAKLNVVNAPNCTNLTVNPGSTYDCAGLSANTTYTANISVASLSGQLATKTSSNISFTTIGLSSTLYVCGQSCTGTLSNTLVQYYISDKRLIEANAAIGGPITSSTCTGSGCNPGTAPALPVTCSAGSSERTNLTTNATAQITTHFRYCSAPTDTTVPVISSGTLSRTGYAPIIPTSGAAGASISVRFIATDNIGIANTSVRLINPGNVVVASYSGSFIAGSVSDGVYSATIATASSGPLGGDVYQIQVQASDASGNSSSWFNLGSYTISSQGTLPTFGAPQISSVTSTYVVVIQPARPSNWLSSYEVIAEVYSLDERTRIGASSEGSYYSPGMTQSVSANNPGGIAPGNTYKVRFALRDTILNRFTYGPFTTFTTPTADTQNPVVVAGSGSIQQSTVTVGQSVTFTFRATDDIGVNSAGGIMYNGSQLVSQGSGATRISGTATDGIWRMTLNIPAANSAGTYTIQGFAQDALAKSSGYVPVGSVVVTLAVSQTQNQLRVLISDPDSSGVSNISFCFTNPEELSGYVNWTSPQIGSGSFLKHSGTPACPNPAGVSVGQRLIPATTYTFSVTASNNGRNYSNSITITMP
jgi:hypothetical protein